jgi:hypothetical protein
MFENLNSFHNLKQTFVNPYDLLLSISVSTYFLTLFGFFLGFKLFKSYQSKSESNESNELNQFKSQLTTIPDKMVDRMLFYESFTEKYVQNIKSGPFIVRLKGRKFTQYDILSENYIKMMNLVGELLMREFHAQTAATYNDEILLVFSTDSDKPYHFNGNCLKLLTSISSYASSIISSETNFEKCSFFANIVTFPEFNKIDLLNYITYKTSGYKPIFIKRESYEDNRYNHICFTFDKIKANITHLNFITMSSFVRGNLDKNLKLNLYYPNILINEPIMNTNYNPDSNPNPKSTFEEVFPRTDFIKEYKINLEQIKETNSAEQSEPFEQSKQSEQTVQKLHLYNKDFDCICEIPDVSDRLLVKLFGRTPRNAASQAYRYLWTNNYINLNDQVEITITYKDFYQDYMVNYESMNDDNCHFMGMILVKENYESE